MYYVDILQVVQNTRKTLCSPLAIKFGHPWSRHSGRRKIHHKCNRDKSSCEFSVTETEPSSFDVKHFENSSSNHGLFSSDISYRNLYLKYSSSCLFTGQEFLFFPRMHFILFLLLRSVYISSWRSSCLSRVCNAGVTIACRLLLALRRYMNITHH
jgi:hypothetical protein